MPPPIATSDLIFSSQATDFSRTLSSLKRCTLSIHNRLNSIISDADFVKDVAQAYDLPLIANERCGSWYIRPEDKAGSAYFKSTDGHMGQWSFSLRRLNVQVFDVVARYGGVVVVDSTRRGKSMPDALMKTVPIWCSVFNRLLFPQDENAGGLHTPPKCVSASEHAQIEQHLNSFVAELSKLKLDLNDLRSKITKPLRPLWVTQESDLPSLPPVFNDFHPIVLCTASKRVKGAEISGNGYIQGAGDDAEGWSQDLTPAVFWKHKDDLMKMSEDELPVFIASLLVDSSNEDKKHTMLCIKNVPWLSISPLTALTTDTIHRVSAIITIGTRASLPKNPIPEKNQLHLECRHRKLGSRDLRTQLPQLRPFIQSLPAVEHILVCDASGKDLAPGVALALLCLYANENGSFQQKGAETSIDKDFIKQRLSWIMTSHPAASPSRTTLQSINDYLLTEHIKGLPARMENKLGIKDPDPAEEQSSNIFKSLEGEWVLRREIINHRSDGLAGKVSGTASFVARSPTSDIAQAEYLYREEGIFDAGPGIQMTVNRRWIWRLEKKDEENAEEPAMSIHFVKADGETEDYLYNRLPLPNVVERKEDADGSVEVSVDAEHPCGRDFYVSKYMFCLSNGVLVKWTVTHRVTGPAKDYISTTTHARP